MCGIVGIVRFDGAPVEVESLRRMAGQLAHRGPDGEGYWADGPVGFGHRRLSIIDLVGSHQPMASEDGQLHVTFNGEVMNYRDLRASWSYSWRTAGDTEVLLAGYRRHGIDFVEQLIGQFGFALHDAESASTWLVRDRIGILPLYYHLDARRLVFASEIKALLPEIGRVTVDERGLAEYLAHRSVPAPWTLFDGVRKLPPGHVLRVRSDGRTELEAFWTPPEERAERWTEEEACARLDEALANAIRRSQVADVPVGSYLSGGLDSSLVVALAAGQRGGDPIDTFAAGFGDPSLDELPYARRVAAHFGTRHHEVHVRPDDFTREWRRLTWHRDAPLSEPADVAVARLAAEASTVVKVVLSGEGSDELFAGYPKYRLAGAADVMGRLPSSVRRPLALWAARHMPPRGRRVAVALRALAHDEPERLRAWFAPFSTAERAMLLGKPAPEFETYPGRAPRGDLVRRMLMVDSGAWLSDNLLERGDRMTMSASVELRPPFLDAEVVDLAWTLPSTMKVRRGSTKWLLRRVAAKHLPAEIIDRPKAGFRVPLDSWFRGGLRELAGDLLLSPNSFVSSVFDRRELTRLLSDHEKGRSSEAIRLWTLVGLEVWHQTFFGAGAGRSIG